MAEWFFRKKSKGEVERDPGWDEYFTSNRSTDDSPMRGNAASYVRALDMLGPILTKHYPNPIIGGSMWHGFSLADIHALHEWICAEMKKGAASPVLADFESPSYWTFCLVALRRVRDALEKYDIVAFPEMRESYERRKSELFALKGKFNKDTPFAECLLDYLIYHRLVHGERNIAVHEVEQTYSDPWTFLRPNGLSDLGDIYLPMGDIDLWSDWDCRDWLKEGIDWWRNELKTLADVPGLDCLGIDNTCKITNETLT